VYESTDGGRTWEERFRPPQTAEVRALAVQRGEPPIVLAATSRGLYGVFEGGESWSEVFSAAGEGASDCTVVAFHPNHPRLALLGTRRGLALSSDSGRTWRPAGEPLAARDVMHAAFHPRQPARVYLVTADGLWEGELVSGSWYQRRLLIHAEEAEVEQPAPVEDPETGEENGSLHRLSAVAVDPEQPNTLYLATSRGVETSEDDGRTWKRLGRSGLASPEVIDLLAKRRSPLALFAATARGVARYEPASDRWVPLTQGRAASRTSDLSAAGGVLWAATEEGLVRFEVPPEVLGAGEPPSPQELLANFSHEPTIGQVHEAAIRYAEVQPHKIQAWRMQARLRALVPKFSMSGDTNLTDFRHWDSGSNPDALLKGERDIDWSATISWEPADLVWSTDQTSIDVRSKLMVELRDDIVDEVTRTYFERRRIQVALLMEPPKSPKTILEKELRIQELTALIDGLTGGYFSAQMQVTGTQP
jgi:photosystem II stability/assembly factor-like uncharacterized protein